MTKLPPNSLALGVLLSLCTLGCAPLRPNLRYSPYGAADLEREKQVADEFDESRARRDRAGEGVQVLMGAVPEGISIDGMTIRVEEGYEHRVLGRFVLGGELKEEGLTSTLRFADYDAGWRKGYCYPQVILSWATLLIWPVFVPASYPCYGTAFRTKAEWIDLAKLSAKAAGGNTVLGGYLFADGDRAAGFSGIIIDLRPHQTAPSARPTQEL